MLLSACTNADRGWGWRVINRSSWHEGRVGVRRSQLVGGRQSVPGACSRAATQLATWSPVVAPTGGSIVGASVVAAAIVIVVVSSSVAVVTTMSAVVSIVATVNALLSTTICGCDCRQPAWCDRCHGWRCQCWRRGGLRRRYSWC